MITIKKGASTKYCNACTEGLAVVDITLKKRGGNFSSTFSLCSDCLRELEDVSKQAVIALTGVSEVQ